MANTSGPGKINVKVVAIVAAVVVVLGAALLAARQIRRRVLSARDLAAGSAAYEQQEWADAIRHFREYLGRNREDVEILKKYGEANLSVTPIERGNVGAAIAAYRSVLRLSPHDAVSYEKLAMLYMAVGDHSELAHVARKRLDVSEKDLDAPIWLARALVALHEPDDAREKLTKYIQRPEFPKKTKKTRHPQYVDARAILGEIEAGNDLPEAWWEALKHLDGAVEYDEKSPHALVQRARFYRTVWLNPSDRRARELMREMAERPKKPLEGKSPEELRGSLLKLTLADLRKARELSPSDPHLRLILCGEWMEWGIQDKDKLDKAGSSKAVLLDKAAAELDAVKDVDPLWLKEHLLRESDWVVAWFRQASLLVRRRGVKLQDVLMTEEALEKVVEPRKRINILPHAARVFLAAGEAAKTSGAVDEYVKAIRDAEPKPESRQAGPGPEVTREEVLAKMEELKKLSEPRERFRELLNDVREYVAKGQDGAAREMLATMVPETFTDRVRAILEQYAQAAKDTHTRAEARSEAARLLPLLEAELARAEGNLYRVIDRLEPIVAANASRRDAWMPLAEAYSRTGQTRRAVDALNQYRRHDPSDPEMLLQLSREYLKLRDWDRAAETAGLAEKAQEKDQENIAAKVVRIEASIHMAVGRPGGRDDAKLAELADELAGLREKNRQRADIRVRQAVIANLQDRPDAAETHLKDAIRQCKEPRQARMLLVRHYSDTKRPAKAMEACREACEKHRDLAQPWLALSALHELAGQHDQARVALRKGLKATEGRPGQKRLLRIGLALAELANGDRSRGTEELEKLTESDPHEVAARSLLLGLPEIRRDAARRQKLITELRSAQGESGLLWRLQQASAWMAAEGWRDRQEDVAELLGRCIDARPDWPAPALLLATMHKRLGNARRQEEVLRQAFARNRWATEVADRLVSLLERRRRLAEARDVLRRVDARSPVRSKWGSWLAEREGDLAGAINQLKLRLPGEPDNAALLISLARVVFRKTGDPDQAFAYLDKAEKIDPKSMAPVLLRVAIHRQSGQDKEARAVLDKRVEKDGTFAAYWLRASYLAETGQAESAEKDFIKLTTFADHAARGYEALSTFYATTGRLDDAVATLDKAATTYPDDPSVKHSLMRALMLRKAPGKEGAPSDVDRAETILAELQGKLPNNPELMRVRAVRLLREGTPEANTQARDLLERAVRLEPTLVNAHLALIGSAMQRRAFAEARNHATRALDANPDHPLLTLARARAEMSLNNAPMAAELTRSVLRKYPGSRDARGVFVDIAVSAGDAKLLDEALEMAAKAIADNPADEAPRLWQAHLLHVAKQSDKAIEGLEAFCRSKEGSRSFDAFLALAELYRVQGETDTCRRMIDQAAELKPGSPA
ncbi:MAG: tetratricopeptide repeat protein, partial [Planctomycetota bacterium]